MEGCRRDHNVERCRRGVPPIEISNHDLSLFEARELSARHIGQVRITDLGRFEQLQLTDREALRWSPIWPIRRLGNRSPPLVGELLGSLLYRPAAATVSRSHQKLSLASWAE